MPDESRSLNVYSPFELLAMPKENRHRACTNLSSFTLDAGQALDLATEPVWLVDGMIAKGNVIILAGPAKKAGKSWLSLHLAQCVAKGIPFLGHKTLQAPVVYANVEDGIGRIGWRMRVLGFDRADSVRVMPQRNGLLPLFEAMPGLALDQNVGLVVIDPLAKLERAHGIEDENDSLQLDSLLDYYQTMAQGVGLSILICHHFAKTTDRMRGSTAIEGGSAGWWNLSPGRPSYRCLSGTLRDGPDFDFGVRYDFLAHPGRLTVTAVSAEQAAPADAKRRRKKDEDDDEDQTRRTEAETYAIIVGLLRTRAGDPITKTDLAGLVGGRKQRTLRVIDRVLEDGAARQDDGMIVAATPFEV